MTGNLYVLNYELNYIMLNVEYAALLFFFRYSKVSLELTSKNQDYSLNPAPSSQILQKLLIA